MALPRNDLKIPESKGPCRWCGGSPVTVMVVSKIGGTLILDEPCVKRAMGPAYDGGPKKKEEVRHDVHRGAPTTGGVLATGSPRPTKTLRATIQAAGINAPWEGSPSPYTNQGTRTHTKLADQETKLGYLTAWRFWVWYRGRLNGLFLPGMLNGPRKWPVWPREGPITAMCIVKKHRIPLPVWSCTCGVHASTVKGLNYGLEMIRNELVGDRILFGQVALWGNVITHRHGFRAQYARPLRIFAEMAHGGIGSLDPVSTRTAKALQANYGLEVGTPEEATEIIRAVKEVKL